MRVTGVGVKYLYLLDLHFIPVRAREGQFSPGGLQSDVDGAGGHGPPVLVLHPAAVESAVLRGEVVQLQLGVVLRRGRVGGGLEVLDVGKIVLVSPVTIHLVVSAGDNVSSEREREGGRGGREIINKTKKSPQFFGEFALLEPGDGAGRGDITDGQLTAERHVLPNTEAVVTGLAGDHLRGRRHHPRHRHDLDGVSDGPVLVLHDAGVVPIVLQPVVLYGQLSVLGDPHYGQTAVPASLTQWQTVFSPFDAGLGTPAMLRMRRGGPRDPGGCLTPCWLDRRALSCGPCSSQPAAASRHLAS